jgi:predicted HTH domain antitoxin
LIAIIHAEIAMPLTIPDEVLSQAGLTEAEARLEFACRLFDAGRLSIHQAAKLAGLDRYALEDQLHKRKIPVYRPTVEDLRHDVAALEKLGI